MLTPDFDAANADNWAMDGNVALEPFGWTKGYISAGVVIDPAVQCPFTLEPGAVHDIERLLTKVCGPATRYYNLDGSLLGPLGIQILPGDDDNSCAYYIRGEGNVLHILYKVHAGNPLTPGSDEVMPIVSYMAWALEFKMDPETGDRSVDIQEYVRRNRYPAMSNMIFADGAVQNPAVDRYVLTDWFMPPDPNDLSALIDDRISITFGHTSLPLD
ncbi:MAG: hypothetical protein Phyf2KO_11110 [Phycisphaerales bacterium]